MNSFEKCFQDNTKILMEAALAERVRRQYKISVDNDVALASMVYDEKKRLVLKKLFCEYIEIARKYELPIILTTPTRRANKDRVLKSKYSQKIIEDNVRFLKDIRSEFDMEIYIGGLMGCKGDAYKSDDGLGISESRNFHFWQANLFKKSNIDFLYAGIMPTLDEAIGMAKAMEQTELPYIISFMIRRDGKLIDGTSISEAIKIIDKSVDRIPICYMTNCVHPDIVHEALCKEFNKTVYVKNRFKGIQANAANLNPENLDNSCELVTSNPVDLANGIIRLYQKHSFKIFGGCCGTDDQYLNEIARRIIQY